MNELDLIRMSDLQYAVIDSYMEYSEMMLFHNCNYIPSIFDLALTSLPGIPLEDAVPRVIETIIKPFYLFVRIEGQYFYKPTVEVW